MTPGYIFLIIFKNKSKLLTKYKKKRILLGKITRIYAKIDVV